MKGLAYKRDQAERKKAWARRIIKHVWQGHLAEDGAVDEITHGGHMIRTPYSVEFVRRMAVHPRSPCNCCKNGRNNKSVKAHERLSMQEKRLAQDE